MRDRTGQAWDHGKRRALAVTGPSVAEDGICFCCDGGRLHPVIDLRLGKLSELHEHEDLAWEDDPMMERIA